MKYYWGLKKEDLKNLAKPIKNKLGGWNGLGREIVNSLNLLDVPVIIGAVIVVSFSFIMINIFVDYVYKFLDPRIS